MLRFEQTGEIFDLPVTVTLQYADRRSVDVRVLVTDRLTEQRVPIDGPLRGVEVSDDHGLLAEVRRQPLNKPGPAGVSPGTWLFSERRSPWRPRNHRFPVPLELQE